MTTVENFNNQSFEEELINTVTHGLGAILSLLGAAFLIVMAAMKGTAMDIVSFSIYGFSMVFLYSMSAVYHSIKSIPVKKVFQVFDHCSIFFLILGSYAPICLSLLGNGLGYGLFAVNAAIAVLGIILNAISVKRYNKFSLYLYLLMGWSAIFIIKPLMTVMTLQGFILLLLGGLSYSIGVFFYNAKHPRYMHCIWHLFVLGGSVFHFFFMATSIL